MSADLQPSYLFAKKRWRALKYRPFPHSQWWVRSTATNCQKSSAWYFVPPQYRPLYWLSMWDLPYSPKSLSPQHHQCRSLHPHLGVHCTHKENQTAPQRHIELKIFSCIVSTSNCYGHHPWGNKTDTPLSPCLLYHTKANYTRTGTTDYTVVPVNCFMNAALSSVDICHDHFPNSFVRAYAAITASTAAARKPPCSRAQTPAMVLPPGLHTASFNAAGWLSVAIS